MNKFTDFSDQVTFVSSQIIGRDFSSLEYYGFTFKSKEALDRAKTEIAKWKSSGLSKSDIKSKIKSTFSGDIVGSGSGNKPGKNNGQNVNPPNSGSWKDLREADEVLKYAESEKGWGKDSPEAEEARRQRSATFENMRTSTESKILEGQIANLKLEKEKSKLERQKRIRDDGGIVRHGGVGLINVVTNSKAGKNLPKFHRDDWEEDVTDRVFGKGEVRPEGSYERNGRLYVKHNKDSITSYLSNNGDRFAKAAGETVVTAGKTAGNALMRVTGYDPDKDSERTSKLKSKLESNKNRQIKSLERIVRNETKYQDKHGAVSDELRTKVTNVSSDIGSRSPSVVKDSADLAGTAVRSARHGVAQGVLRLNQARLEHKEKKIDQAIKDSKNQEKFDHIKKVTGTVGAGVTVAKSAISSKARERVIQQEGVEGLQQKQAKLLYLLGDRSKDTKIAVGDKKGLGLIGRVKANAYQRKIDRNREQYRQSLNAQYQPPQAYAPYYYPRAAGFSEDQITALNGILSRDFSSEGAEAFEGLNLSWQPEEYAKLNTILEADFETLDAQIAETQPDMSEKKVKEEEKVDEQQVDDSQSGEIDVSDTIDYDNLDPETMTALIDRSYYEAPEEEKQYQEMIAKGFAEKESSYNNFLESMSNFVDMSL